MAHVLLIGDSHLKRIADVFQFPSNFTIEARGGAHLCFWLELKEAIKEHEVWMVMLGGNNLIAKPNDPIQYKEEMKMVIGQLTRLRNFCNGNSVKRIIWQVINLISSCKEPFDIIRALNNRLAENKLKLHFRTSSYEEDFLPDNVHMKDWWYVNAGFDLANMCSSAPETRPDLVDITLPNFN